MRKATKKEMIIDIAIVIQASAQCIIERGLEIHYNVLISHLRLFVFWNIIPEYLYDEISDLNKPIEEYNKQLEELIKLMYRIRSGLY